MILVIAADTILHKTETIHWQKDFDDFFGGLNHIFSIIAIIVGGSWIYIKFVLFREKYPIIEIENGINYLGENSKTHLLELYCIVKNKGKARKWLAPMDFELLFLANSDNFENNPEINDEINFKKHIMPSTHYNNRKFWVYPNWYIPFVDGESQKRFHYLLSVPDNYYFLSLNTRFIDFNNKKKAINEIEALLNIKSSEVNDDPWMKKSIKEQLYEIGSKNTDYYYTQVTLTMQSIIAKSKSNV